MKKHALFASCLLLAAAVAAPANAAELIQNGNFSGGLANWSSYTTANGNIAENPSMPGAPQPQDAMVSSFNVTGSGAQNALFLNVGAVNPPYGASQQGGGVFQTFTSDAGTASFSAAIAAFSRTGNTAAGLFSVLLDGVEMASFDFGAITAMDTERGVLNFTTALTAGTHTLSLQATRPFGPGRGVNAQYFTNVSFDQVAAVPEPATWAMLIAGFGLVGGAMRRRPTARVTYA